MNISVILPAAGLGRRFAVGEKAYGSKIEFELGGKPVFLRAIELFQGLADVGEILLAVEPGQIDDFRFRWEDQLAFQGVTLISGGQADRWETVKLALKQVSDAATHVAVHDAARPCASRSMIERVFAAAAQYGAAVPGVAMGDTVKRVERESGEGEIRAGEGRGASGEAELGSVERERGEGELPGALDALFGGAEERGGGEVWKVVETVDRAGLFRVQTPQVFEKGLLVEAYGRVDAGNAAGLTDDASVVERAGGEVVIVEGDAMNLKLTTPGDVELMEAVLKLREEKDAKDAAVKQLFGDDED